MAPIAKPAFFNVAGLTKAGADWFFWVGNPCIDANGGESFRAAATVLMSVPHLRIMRQHGRGTAMYSRSVLVHCLGRLGAAAAVLAAELLCGDRVFTKWASERRKTIHRFDGVMSHSLNCRRSSRHDSKLKLQPVIGQHVNPST
jgi:hypothetical protein